MTELTEAKRALLARRLRARAAAPVIAPRPAGEQPPLSFAQERLWFIEQYSPGTGAYVIPIVRRIHRDLDFLPERLARLVTRHEPLRTRFPTGEDGRPVAVVEPSGTIPLSTVDASTEDEARERVDEFLREPFDLETGPVCRALLIRLGPADHVLALALHHIAGDGWSAELLLRDLLDADVPEPAVSYGDYARWQRDRDAGGDLAYWAGRLAGATPLELPSDRPRPPELTYGGAAHAFRLPPDLNDRLTTLARKHNATPYMLLLAAFATVLGRYAGQHDVTIGSPVAGRPHPELENLVGCFVNLLAMRVDLGADPSFVDLLGQVRETALDAFSHQELPFEHLVAELDVPRDVSRSPVFGVLFAMQNYADPGRGALDDEPFDLRSWHTRYDLELYAGSGDFLFVYNTDLFDVATIGRLAGHFTTLLAAVADAPDTSLSALPLLGETEWRLIDSWNATDTPFPAETLQALIEAQVQRTPDAVAVTFEGSQLSFVELNERANRIAHTLRARGIGRGALVGVCAPRSFDLVAALLGVLKSGAAYVPLDPGNPPERLAFMAEDSGIAVLLSTEHDLDLPGPVLWLDDDVWAAETHDPEQAAGPDDIAYVIYTSGSTGKPKGVPNTQRGIVNRLDWMRHDYAIGPEDVVLQKTAATFDVSVWEFFLPLLTGARLVLARPDGHRDAAYLVELIAAESVTTVHFVPSMLTVFLAEEGAARCGSLQRVFCSGEELPVDVARRCLDVLPAELHNLYGPTEAAIDVSAWHCTTSKLAGLARVPIGAPVANTQLHVLDERGEPAPIGVPGELYIGGVQVAAGYLNRPELTAQRFVRGLYRTGDRARWRPDGTLDFLGRLDDQVKLRGFRIEPGEIEAALRTQPDVEDAAVVVREDRPGDKRLVAYTVGADGDRAALKRVLPEHMVPAAFVTLDALPRTSSGKLDRRALPAPQVKSGEYVPPATATEQAVAEIWADVLGVERVGAEDDFFALGGHSLLVIAVVAKLRAAVGAGVSVMDVFKNPTVRELAALVDTPDRGPRRLLYELTPKRNAEVSYVCVPYGGGSAAVYQPLADELPETAALWSVAIPGHDVGLDEDRLPFDELAERCAGEVLERVSGPLVLYGHCGVGSALIVAIARRLEAAGRELDAVYIGAIFPFGRPRGRGLGALARAARMERLRGDQGYANWLTSMGVDLTGIEPGQARRIIRNMRRDSEAAEEYFSGLFESKAERLRAPIVTVAGERDPATDYFQERFREWHFLTDVSAVVVLDEAGHFFLKYRAAELATIVTHAHLDVESPLDGPHWRRDGVSRSTSAVTPAGVQPSMKRFLAVAAGQLVSLTGSALTEFAIPIWIYLTSGSVVRFALFAVVGLVPGMLVAPLAGAVVDRMSRRAVMLGGDIAAFATQLALGLLLWTGNLQTWQIYPLLACLSVALTFQRLAYVSAVPQLVPKRFLGHANGVVQLATGTAQLLVPMVAVGLLAAIDLSGILVLDVVSYAFAIVTTLLVRFPRTMAWRRKEPVLKEMAAGFRYSWGHPGFRRMLLFFAGLNVFLSPLFLMVSPLVLSFAPLTAAGTVALLSGLGVFLGGLAIAAWGGPRRRRMRGVLLCTLVLAVFCLVTGLQANLVVVAAGAFGMALGLTLLNGIYTTIVQVKVPQRFHGRVFALNTLIAWSTLPIGFGLVAPYATSVLEPLLMPGGALAGTVGVVIGVGPGRGIALLYVVCAVAIAVVAGLALRSSLARFDDDVPDTVADDLVGLEALKDS